MDKTHAKHTRFLAAALTAVLLLGMLPGCGAPQLEAVELAGAAGELDVHAQAVLTLTAQPEGASLEGVVICCEDETVARVENGVLHTLAPGTTAVYAQNADGTVQSDRLVIHVVDMEARAQLEDAVHHLSEAIGAIGEVTLASGPFIEAARTAYDAAPVEVRALLPNAGALFAAEEQLAQLQAKEQERLAAERAEQERLAKEKAEQERLAKEKAEKERLAKEQAAKEAAEKARQEAERQAAEEKKRQEEASKPAITVIVLAYLCERDHTYHRTDENSPEHWEYLNALGDIGYYYLPGEFVKSSREYAREHGYKPCPLCMAGCS